MILAGSVFGPRPGLSIVAVDNIQSQAFARRDPVPRNFDDEIATQLRTQSFARHDPQIPEVLAGTNITLVRNARGVVVSASGGGGSFAATQVTLTLPYPAKRSHVVNVIDAAVLTTAFKIIPVLAGSDDNSTNESNMTDLLTIVGQPLVGSINFKLEFLTPAAGPFLVNYAIAA